MSVIRNNVGQFVKGSVPDFSDTHRLKISLSKQGESNPMFGVKQTKDHIEKRILRGLKHWNWKGGISPVESLIKSSFQYRHWRTNVLRRDYFRCIWCGSKKNLEVDHLIAFSLIVSYLKVRFGIEKLYNKVVNDPLFNSVENGRTLCRDCHKLITFRPYAISSFGNINLLSMT